ncbi:hypothetical protein RFI_22651 [Reticulomyxa filosa]|uniref:Uncharacterized protein n=1 Tax=Reticulomyxa filosa TaxID=46433 RepID=X6MMQ0_RETFI|nr:hypothetical protein RFI_22651 [Reticulomyxa filosa]|eukprot:ETO14717.1 hypothetical protein RFI_22651 [Reticulomyxa filosa]
MSIISIYLYTAIQILHRHERREESETEFYYKLKGVILENIENEIKVGFFLSVISNEGCILHFHPSMRRANIIFSCDMPRQYGREILFARSFVHFDMNAKAMIETNKWNAKVESENKYTQMTNLVSCTNITLIYILQYVAKKTKRLKRYLMMIIDFLHEKSIIIIRYVLGVQFSLQPTFTFSFMLFQFYILFFILFERLFLHIFFNIKTKHYTLFLIVLFLNHSILFCIFFYLSCFIANFPDVVEKTLFVNFFNFVLLLLMSIFNFCITLLIASFICFKTFRTFDNDVVVQQKKKLSQYFKFKMMKIRYHKHFQCRFSLISQK